MKLGNCIASNELVSTAGGRRVSFGGRNLCDRLQLGAVAGAVEVVAPVCGDSVCRGDVSIVGDFLLSGAEMKTKKETSVLAVISGIGVTHPCRCRERPCQNRTWNPSRRCFLHQDPRWAEVDGTVTQGILAEKGEEESLCVLMNRYGVCRYYLPTSSLTEAGVTGENQPFEIAGGGIRPLATLDERVREKLSFDPVREEKLKRLIETEVLKWDLEGLSYAEIAQRTRMRPDHVRRICRASGNPSKQARRTKTKEAAEGVQIRRAIRRQLREKKRIAELIELYEQGKIVRLLNKTGWKNRNSARTMILSLRKKLVKIDLQLSESKLPKGTFLA